MLLIVKNDADALVWARQAARLRNGTFRAPHHTVSAAGLMSELAIAAGGVLWLGSAEEYTATALAALGNTWAMMRPDLRPVVYFALSEPERERARPDQPRVKVTQRVLFEERVARAEAFARQTWPEVRPSTP